MAMRNLLLIAAGFIILMGSALIFFGDEQKNDTGMNQMAAADASSSLDASLIGARQAYWAGDIAQAESLYSKIITTNADNINAWGELGNIYYMQAKWKKAANAYAEVTLLLIDKKDMQQAAFFHGLVNQMDREQSERINERLRSLNNI